MLELAQQVKLAKAIKLPTDYVLNAAFEVAIDKNQIKHRLAKKVNELTYQLQRYYESISETYPRVSTTDYKVMFLPDLTNFETLVFELIGEIQTNGLYINGRYLPFNFEHFFNTGVVVLSKISAAEFFYDLAKEC